MELIGTIERILNKEQISDTFVKRNLVLKTNEAYPQKILIEFTQEKIALLDLYKEGTEVKVSINIRGREWQDREGNTRYYNSINGWKIEPLSQNNSNSGNQSSYSNYSASGNSKNNKDDFDTDDLPF